MGPQSRLPLATTSAEAAAVTALRLLRSRRVGAVTWHRLVEEYGTAEAALAALPEIAQRAGVEGYEACPEGVALAEIEAGRRLGATLMLHGQPGYPATLADISDAPPALWAWGDLGLLQRPLVALVGARNASSLGLRMARRLAEGLGQAGVCVVSGLARGVDRAAHEASLASGTIAVQAGGIDCPYPEENLALHAQIRDQGCLISEQPPGVQPQTRHFPARNRIIAGLSQAVVVVEAAARSGSLITAKAALDQGRDVLVVPGHPFDARVAGSNLLIRDGATLVRGPADVLEAIGMTAPDAAPLPKLPPLASLPGPVPPRRPLKEIAALHRKILDRLGPTAVAEDQLIRDLSLPPATISQQLVTLELEGRVSRGAGGMIRRAK